MAEGDAALGEVVGRHFYGDAVAFKDADLVLAHFARAVAQDDVPVVELDAEHGVREQLRHDAVKAHKVFFF